MYRFPTGIIIQPTKSPIQGPQPVVPRPVPVVNPSVPSPQPTPWGQFHPPAPMGVYGAVPPSPLYQNSFNQPMRNPVAPTRPIMSMKKGGKVPKTGIYKLHAGEVVVPKERVNRRMVKQEKDVTSSSYDFRKEKKSKMKTGCE